jgi:hypothetical protein
MRRTTEAFIAGTFLRIGVAVGISVLAACGGAAGPTFDGSTYRQGPVAFRIGAVPVGWRTVDVDHATLAYRDDAHGASVLLNGRCHRPDEGTPLLALTNHLVMGSTERKVVAQETEPFDGREALHTKMNAKWDGVPMAFDIFVAKKDGCTYDFVYMGDPTAFEAGAGEFEAFVRGFHTLPGSGTVPKAASGSQG